MTAAMLSLGDPEICMKILKKQNAPAQPPTSKSSNCKTKANSKLDSMLLAAFGMDPKLDPITAVTLDLDPKNLKFNAMLLATLGIDSKNLNSTSLTVIAERNDATRIPGMLILLPNQEVLVNEMVHSLAQRQGRALCQETEEIIKTKGPHKADFCCINETGLSCIIRHFCKVND